MRAPTPPLTLVLDGQEYAYVLDLAALYRAEQRLRRLAMRDDLNVLLAAAAPGVTETIVLTWAGLSSMDPTLTEERVTALLSSGEALLEARKAIVRSGDAFFAPRSKDAASDRPLPPSTGSASGPSPDRISGSATPTSGG